MIVEALCCCRACITDCNVYFSQRFLTVNTASPLVCRERLSLWARSWFTGDAMWCVTVTDAHHFRAAHVLDSILMCNWSCRFTFLPNAVVVVRDRICLANQTSICAPLTDDWCDHSYYCSRDLRGRRLVLAAVFTIKAMLAGTETHESISVLWLMITSIVLWSREVMVVIWYHWLSHLRGFWYHWLR